jgi:hypothetical protein
LRGTFIRCDRAALVRMARLQEVSGKRDRPPNLIVGIEEREDAIVVNTTDNPADLGKGG